VKTVARQCDQRFDAKEGDDVVTDGLRLRLRQHQFGVSCRDSCLPCGRVDIDDEGITVKYFVALRRFIFCAVIALIVATGEKVRFASIDGRKGSFDSITSGDFCGIDSEFIEIVVVT
jgi:hypothetical protein